MVQPDPPRQSGRLVLIVEDADSDAYLATSVLQMDGAWQVIVCGTLADAIEHAPDADAILLDLGLPDSQGLATLARVRAVAPDTAIVVLTGTDDGAVASEAIRLGAQDYVLKGEQRHNLLPQVLDWAMTREQRTLHDSSADPRGLEIMDRAEGMLVARHTLRLHRRTSTPMTLLLVEFRADQATADLDVHAVRQVLDEVLVVSCRSGDLVVHLEGTRYMLVVPNDYGVGPTAWLQSTLAERRASGSTPTFRLSVGAVAVGPDDAADLATLMGLATLLLGPV